MWAVWIAAALAANPYEGLDADVRATATTSMSPDAVIAAFSDLPAAMRRFEGSCATIDGAVPTGVNLTWTPSMMHRRVHVTVDEVKPGRRIDLDMASLRGDRGFTLRVEVAPQGEGADVTLLTPLTAPGWPLRGLYFKKIRPAWAACYVSAILALDPSATITGMTGPPAG